MLCRTSVLSLVLRSVTLGLRRAVYAVLYICAVICAQISSPGLRRAALCCAADLCSDPQLGFGRAALCCAAHLCCICALSSGPRA